MKITQEFLYIFLFIFFVYLIWSSHFFLLIKERARPRKIKHQSPNSVNPNLRGFIPFQQENKEQGKKLLLLFFEERNYTLSLSLMHEASDQYLLSLIDKPEPLLE